MGTGIQGICSFNVNMRNEDALNYDIGFCERVVGETGTKYKKPVLIDLIFTLTAPVQFFKVLFKQMAEQELSGGIITCNLFKCHCFTLALLQVICITQAK